MASRPAASSRCAKCNVSDRSAKLELDCSHSVCYNCLHAIQKGSRLVCPRGCDGSDGHRDDPLSHHGSVSAARDVEARSAGYETVDDDVSWPGAGAHDRRGAENAKQVGKLYPSLPPIESVCQDDRDLEWLDADRSSKATAPLKGQRSSTNGRYLDSVNRSGLGARKGEKGGGRDSSKETAPAGDSAVSCFDVFVLPAQRSAHPSKRDLQEIGQAFNCDLKLVMLKDKPAIRMIADSQDILNSVQVRLRALCEGPDPPDEVNGDMGVEDRRALSQELTVTPAAMRLLKKTKKGELQQLLHKHRCSMSDIDSNAKITISGSSNASVKQCTDEFFQLYRDFKDTVEHKVCPIPYDTPLPKALSVVKDLQSDSKFADVDFAISDSKVVISGQNHSLRAAIDAVSFRLQRNDSRGGPQMRTSSQYEDFPASKKLLLSHVTNSGITVEVLQGDITAQDVDTIVNAANDELRHIGGLAKKIAEGGGRVINEQSRNFIRSHGPLHPGEVAHTSGGRLPCKHVIHAVGPRWTEHSKRGGREYLQLACRNSLMKAVSLKAQSIAIPAIGAGIYGVPKRECAEQMLKVTEAFCRQPPSQCTITLIRFVLFEQGAVDAFRVAFSDFFSRNVAFARRRRARSLRVLPTEKRKLGAYPGTLRTWL